MSRSLDHGMLNLPLDKRGGGSIDAQLDRYKADKAREERAEVREHSKRTKALRAEVKAAIDALPADVVERSAAKVGKTPKQYIKTLRSLSYWQPAKFLPLIQKLNGAA